MCLYNSQYNEISAFCIHRNTLYPNGTYRYVLTDMVNVLDIINLVVVRHSHEVEQFSHTEEPVLHRVDRHQNVLADDGGEGVGAHEADRVIPVPEVLAELLFHMLQSGSCKLFII